MINLKSELFKKERQVKELKSQNATLKASTVSAYANSGNKKVPSWLKKNSGVNKRNQKDLVEVLDEDKHSQVNAILEAKSKMYDKMTSGDFICDNEDAQVFLVDFEQKSIDAWRDRSEKANTSTKPEVNVKVASEVTKAIDEAKDEWVEYVDSFGRTRTCLKKDLPLIEKDEKLGPNINGNRTLMSDDMRREEERIKWEKNAVEELQDELHYENLRFGEIRELGVGYYAFSGKQEERDSQMKRLEALRKETEKRKQANEAKKQKQQTMLTARLEKVRQRRIKQLQAQGKEIPASLLEPVKVEPVEAEKEKVPEVAETPAVETNSLSTGPVKTREWDEGKDDWVPARAPVAPRSWNDPRNERPSEFAPPSFYYCSSSKRSADNVTEAPEPKLPKPENEDNSSPDDADRIQRVLDELKKPTQEETVPSSSTNDHADSEPTFAPYIPSDKPVTMKISSKPNKLNNVSFQ